MKGIQVLTIQERIYFVVLKSIVTPIKLCTAPVGPYPHSVTLLQRSTTGHRGHLPTRLIVRVTSGYYIFIYTLDLLYSHVCGYRHIVVFLVNYKINRNNYLIIFVKNCSKGKLNKNKKVIHSKQLEDTERGWGWEGSPRHEPPKDYNPKILIYLFHRRTTLPNVSSRIGY